MLVCLQLPVNRRLPHLLQECVGFGEMLAAEESAVGRQWGGVGSGEHVVFPLIDECSLADGVTSP